MLEFILQHLPDWLRRAIDAPFSQKARIFSHIFAPTLVVLFMGVSLGDAGANLAPEESVSIVPVRSKYSPGGSLQEAKGFTLLVEPTELDFAVQLRGGEKPEVNLSIEPSLVAVNRRRIRVENDVIELSMPLLGVSEPLVVNVSGEPSETAQIFAKSFNTSQLRLFSKNSRPIVTWLLFSVIFGLGLMLQPEDLSPGP